MGGSGATGRYRRLFWKGCIGLLAGGALLAASLSLLGAYGVVGPGITFYSLLTSAGFAGGWVLVLVALFVVRRRAYRTHWRALLAGTAIWLGGFALAGYLIVVGPRWHIRNDFRGIKDDGEARAICHRFLIWSSYPHDAFLSLGYLGDKTSVPYILWAFRSWPNWDGSWECTWSHGLKALRLITNHPTKSKEAWMTWYEANKHKSMLEWWADGFTAEGYPVSVAGGEVSILSMLEALGRTPCGQLSDKGWLETNAQKMLELWDQQEVRRVVDNAVQTGTAGQRCGAARYARKMPRADAEPILQKLAKDKDRAVRLWASDSLTWEYIDWLKNPPGSIASEFDKGTFTEQEFLSPPGAKVVPAKVASSFYFGDKAKIAGRSRIDVLSDSEQAGIDEPKPVIFIDWIRGSPEDYNGLVRIGIEGVAGRTQEAVYSTDLVVREKWQVVHVNQLYDGDTHSIYISLSDYLCRLDCRTGQILWENCSTRNEGIILLQPYIIWPTSMGIMVGDATSGRILAYYECGSSFSNRLSLVDGDLHAVVTDGRLLVLKLPDRE